MRSTTVRVFLAGALAATSVCVVASPPVSAGNPQEQDVGATSPPSVSDIEPRDLVIDQRGLGYLRRSDGSLTPYGHTIASVERPVPRAPGGKPGRPGGGGSDGTITFGEWNDLGQVTKSAGRILFEMSDGWYVCSGTAITDAASDRSIVLTAAHCIYDDVAKAFSTDALFIPNQDDGGSDGTDWDCSNDAFGCWRLDHGVVDINWTIREFPDNIPWDYGYYVVSDTNARSTTSDYTAGATGALDGVVGTLPVDFTTPDLGADAHALGYSYDVDPEFMYCLEGLGLESSYGDYWLANCGMSGGASGGPWVQPMDEAGSGPVFSVNSWGYTNRPGMAGPLLAGTSAESLLEFARTSTLGTGRGYVVDPGGPPVDTAPDVSIAEPIDGAVFGSGVTVLLSGSASDAEDGDLTAGLVWESTIDGGLGSGGAVSTALSPGTHVITASVTDSGGNSSSASVTITVESDGEPPSGIGLTVTTSKDKGRLVGELAWTGASGGNVVVYRDGSSVETTANDGEYTDRTGFRGGGTTTWQVCETGPSPICSDTVSVSW